MLLRGVGVLQVGRNDGGLLHREDDVPFRERLACADGDVRLVLDVERPGYLVCEALAKGLLLNCLLHHLELRLSP